MPEVTGPKAEAAANLLERLLTDQGFRARFRADPVGASRQAGLEEVADEMAIAGGKAMDTLDGRESRSSLAGVLMAAALEGVGIYDFGRDVLPHIADVPEAVGQVLSRLEVPVAAASVEPPASSDAGEFPAITPDQAADHHAAAAAADASDAGASAHGSHEALALLHDRRVTFDANGIADMKSGRMDPRIVSALSAISRNHRITISATISDHPRLTTGGSVSNHSYGRAVDISVVDGRPVGPGNRAAHQVALSLARLPKSIRPTEVGSPWALPGSADFSDAAHQNHLHIGFDDPVGKGWKPPEEVAPAGGGVAAAAPANAAAAASEASGDSGDSSDGSDSGDSSDGGDEPGGLEDPGGDTDAEADQESDGDEGDDSVSDDPSDEQEDDEGDGGDENDEGPDGDHDDSSDSSDSSDDGSDSGGDSGGDGSDDGSDTSDSADGGNA